MKTTLRLALLAASALLCATGAQATVTTVTFEGPTPGAEVRNYYNGGVDGANVGGGPDLGISYYFGAYAEKDLASGGLDFTNTPSGHTALASTKETYINIASGFTDGFSLFYSSSATTVILIYDDVDLKGNVIGGLAINAQYRNSCANDPGDTFCTWSTAGTSFLGTAKSIYLGYTPNKTLFDNMTFGSATPTGGLGIPVETDDGGGAGGGGAVPEPATWALMLAGFGMLGGALRAQRGVVA